MMRNIFALIGMFLYAAAAFSSDAGRPTGRNCDLVSPPASAGELMNHGIVLRIYPQAKDIDAAYTGCQLLFAPPCSVTLTSAREPGDSEKWLVVSMTQIINGDPNRLWFADEEDSQELDCRFRQGKVVQGNPGRCPTPESLIMKSLAPGCSRIIQEAVARHGLGAPLPPQCDEYQ